jgi:hypothetical protein
MEEQKGTIASHSKENGELKAPNQQLSMNTGNHQMLNEQPKATVAPISNENSDLTKASQ